MGGEELERGDGEVFGADGEGVEGGGECRRVRPSPPPVSFSTHLLPCLCKEGLTSWRIWFAGVVRLGSS